MTEFKLGTARVDQEEVAILMVGERIFDIAALAKEGGGSGWGRLAGRTTVLEILESWDELLPALRELAAATEGTDVEAVTPEELLPPVPRPGKVLGVGANYQDHLDEMQAEAPFEPYLFLKPAWTTQIGSGQPLRAPADVRWLDWEAELAVIMGKRIADVSSDVAAAAIAGFAVANDVSGRDCLEMQTPPLGVNWLRHKGYDGFTPIGPAMTPAVFVPDPHNLTIRLSVNGELMQDSNTSKMVTGIYDVIAHASRFTTLEPGDVVLTGTPAGVGFARDPKVSLTPGDVIEVTIAELGSIHTPVIPAG